MLGTITTLKRWDPISRTGGYGFLRDDEGYDRFFHARDLVLGAHAFGTIVAEDARVIFEPTAANGDKQGKSNGLRAIKVDLHGWRWTATLDKHTCEPCKAFHDQLLPPNSPMDELPPLRGCLNPNGCRCVADKRA